MLKPANRYETRLGRRIAIICYAPLIPPYVIGVLLWEATREIIRETPQLCRDIAGVWRK
ncbi:MULTISPECIES: hypothetical protein [unclassified Mesorhizobium]|uniref:hypothetical protein n=1 Tax=unclassified Mesorhizobium TaxID=325217 RepID=UPI0013DEFC68|nr:MULTISPECIES: hypothetical protein [unclassified Mesorhizobium]